MNYDYEDKFVLLLHTSTMILKPEIHCVATLYLIRLKVYVLLYLVFSQKCSHPWILFSRFFYFSRMRKKYSDMQPFLRESSMSFTFHKNME